MSSIFIPMLIYLGIGAMAGLSSGLLGIGGGLVTVPFMVITFSYLHLSENIMRMATGTALAIMCCTTFASTLAHHKMQKIDWYITKRLGIGVMVGALIGRYLAEIFDPVIVAIVFVVIVGLIAIQMFFHQKSKKSLIKQLNLDTSFLITSGVIIGSIGGMLGLSGGMLSVPLLIHNNVCIRKAIGVSATCGFIVAITSTLFIMLQELILKFNSTTDFSSYKCDAIYWPAALGIAFSSMIFVPLGVSIVHNYDREKLKRVFSIFMMFISIYMAWRIFIKQGII